MEYKTESLSDLKIRVGEDINQLLRVNLYEIGLSEKEQKRLRIRKHELREALNQCGLGDLKAKDYVKTVIEDILVGKYHYGEEQWNLLIPFECPMQLTAQDKFQILLYCYEQKRGAEAFSEFMDRNHILDKMADKKQGYCIDDDMVEEIYQKERPFLTAADKKAVIVQEIYASLRGLGVIDALRDMRIDGVSGGVSGKEGDFHSVWVFFRGITMHLKCLSFGNARELERICLNIYRYGNPGQFSKARGYIVNEMKDRSRVVVVRPPFAESCAFFVRKCDTMEKKSLEELITGPRSELPIDLIRYIVQGCQVTAVTGAQGSGKTTLLMGMVGFIHPSFTLRIQEMAFELHLRDIYPDRNILTFRETDTVSGQEGLDVQKKTDGVVNILGEVATAEVAAYLIQMSQVGSLFTLFTHHARTTDSLIKYMRNSLLSCGLFRDEQIAKEQVVECIRFDIHLEKDMEGHRYVERISEICPEKDGYRIEELVRYEEGEYVFCHPLSLETCKEMEKHMTKEDRREFVESRYIPV